MKWMFWFCSVPLIVSLAWKDDEDCWKMMNNKTITNKYAVLVKFSPELHSANESCSVQISNPWAVDMQNGFGVFLPRRLDCSSIVTVECLPGSAFLRQTIPAAVQYTCHSRIYKVEMPCSLIGLTYKRDNNIQEVPKLADVQVVALAKEPCLDQEIFYQCPEDYSGSCIHRQLRCNERSECPSGGDEDFCQAPSPAGIPIIVIIIAVLAFLVLICILSTVLICCCCRAAFNAIIRRFCPSKKSKSLEKGENIVITGEDAGLMKGLTTPSVITALPQRHAEPTTLIIDSTKPVYPRLE